MIVCDNRALFEGIRDRCNRTGTAAPRYSPPMKKLVEEHWLIKRWLALIPEVVSNLDVESDTGRRLIFDGIDMIRSYADKYHHAKEEEILFKYFDENTDIIKVMHEDHKHGRQLVKGMLDALEQRDPKTIAKNLLAYRDLLTEHIHKEDDILFPWMDNQLSARQMGELLYRFEKVDRQMDISPDKYAALIDRLEKEFEKPES